jgi:hypothetical protein
MTLTAPHASRLATLAAVFLGLLALPASAQAPSLGWIEDDATLDALLPSPLVRAQARAGNRVPGGDHELALVAALPGATPTAQRFWSPGQDMPFRVTWDGGRRVTLQVGSDVLARDVPPGFSALALRSASCRRGAGLAVHSLELNHAWLGLGPRARSLDGSDDVQALLVTGLDLSTGFVLRGKVRLSWIQPPPTADELLLEVLLGEPAEVGQDYCAATVNSTGVPCDLSWSGLPSLSAPSLVLHADGGVPSSPCRFLSSPAAQSLPFGNGWLCVGPPIEPLGDFVAFDDIGTASAVVDVGSAPLLGVVPGEVRYFQVWYRDPAGFPEPYNLSDAVALTFLP